MLYAYAGWMLIMNLVCFILMYSDKKRARQHRRRIPERTLLLTGLFGGALGMDVHVITTSLTLADRDPALAAQRDRSEQEFAEAIRLASETGLRLAVSTA